MRKFTQHLVGNTPCSYAGLGSSLPQDVVPHGQGAGFTLSSNALKLIACAAMVMDHVGILFFPGVLIWRLIGRIAFPLFAFLIAEGYRHTSDARAYFLRLLSLALISHIPYVLFLDAANVATGHDLNIFFTLAAGLLALAFWEKLPAASAIPAIGLILGVANYFSFDYGAYGVLLVLCSRLVLYHRKSGIAALFLLPHLLVLARYALGTISVQIYAALSVPFIAAYDGTLGRRLPKTFFYLFYPVHLLLLWLIWLLLKN